MKESFENKRTVTRDQLVTIADLEEFSNKLTENIQKILANGSRAAPKSWLKSDEVRKLLRISSGKLQSLRNNGALPFSRIGGVIYYDSRDIEQLFTKGSPPKP